MSTYEFDRHLLMQMVADASGEQVRVRQEEGIHLTRTAAKET